MHEPKTSKSKKLKTSEPFSLGMEEKHSNIEELDLRLSIGGSYSNCTDPDMKIETLTSFVGDNEPEIDGFKAKCEIYALKRREAKKKREEKKKQRRRESDSIEKHGECKRNKNETTAFSNHWSHLQFAYPHEFVHYGPTANGSLVMPCWFMDTNNNNNNNTFGSGKLNSGQKVGYGYDSERNGGGGNAKGSSNGSSVCTSVTGSGRSSSSNIGSGNKQSRSCSSHSIADSKPMSGQEHSATSHLQESKLRAEATDDTHGTDKSTPSVDTRSIGDESKDETKPHSEQNLCERRALSGRTSDGNLNVNQMSSTLPSMPCVTATGNGPNGRTINGFLYRYMEGEISILCVCHGSSFSPAGFVEHAGGVNVSHPMRHITVVPSAF